MASIEGVREMKLPSIAKIRIPILLVLAVGEIVGLAYFYGQPMFTKFLVLSLAFFMILIPILWFKLAKCIDGSFLIFILIPMEFISLANSLRDRETGIAIMWAIFLFVSIILVLIRIYIEFRQSRKLQGGRA